LVIAESRNIFVEVKAVREKSTSNLKRSGLTRDQRRQAVHDDLVAIASDSQKAILEELKSQNVNFKSFWITNRIYIPDASEALIARLSRRSDVIRVRDEHFAHLIKPVEVGEVTVKKSVAPVWSVELIRAPEAWNYTNGEGIVIANIDTGVRYTHESLIGSYRGNLGTNNTFDHNYNWFDSRGTTNPNDGNGHGTHTMGTIAGSQNSGVGVAPGAKWFAAKGCGTILCSEADLTGSAEYVICPTRLDGSDPDCSLGADVVSNSWGGGQGDDWYASYVDAWQDAGMIPVFAQGNSGPNCETANSPGDLYNVIGVGATDSDDALARFSSRGPGPNAAGFSELKPDISAPGALITSASSSGDALYSVLSGTSMACPSISGVVGLILSANSRLEYDDIYSIITSTAVTDLPAPLGGLDICGGISYTQIPNNHYGYGRVDAAAAVAAALKF